MTDFINEADYCEADYFEEENNNYNEQETNNYNNNYNQTVNTSQNSTNKPTKKIYTLTGMEFMEGHEIYNYVSNKDLAPKMPVYFSIFWYFFAMMIYLVQQLFLILYLEKVSVVRWYIPFAVSVLLLIFYFIVLGIVKEKKAPVLSPRTYKEEQVDVPNSAIRLLRGVLIAHVLQFAIFIIILRQSDDVKKWDAKWEPLSKDGLIYIVALSSFFYYAYQSILRPADRCDQILLFQRTMRYQVAMDCLDFGDLFIVGAWYTLGAGTDRDDSDQKALLMELAWGKAIADFSAIIDIAIVLWLLTIALRVWFMLALHFDFDQPFWRRYTPTKNEEIVTLIQEIIDNGGLKGIYKYSYNLQSEFVSPGFLNSKIKDGNSILTVFDPNINQSNESGYENNNLLITQADEEEEISTLQEMRFQFTHLSRATIFLKLSKLLNKFTLPCNLLSLAIRLMLLVQMQNAIQILFLIKNIFAIYSEISSFFHKFHPNEYFCGGKFLMLKNKTKLFVIGIFIILFYGTICTLADIYMYKIKGNSAWAAPPFTFIFIVLLAVYIFVYVPKLIIASGYNNWLYMIYLMLLLLLCTIAFASRIPILYWGLNDSKNDPLWGSKYIWLLVVSFTIILFLYQKFTFIIAALSRKADDSNQKKTYMKYIEPDYIIHLVNYLPAIINTNTLFILIDALGSIALFRVSSNTDVPKSMHRACIAFCFLGVLFCALKIAVGFHYIVLNLIHEIQGSILIVDTLTVGLEIAELVIRIVLAAKYDISQIIWLYKNSLYLLAWLSDLIRKRILFKYQHYQSIFPEIPAKAIQ
ncbi:hybrid signal transduction histidine kinase m [Anaeramoeba flamelloides]|uniref:Hybrid signal transduction histidine kinase m n=1 Tax=Anaeramoeba flamelloides TaxID=1746091 RepID=A0AAV7Y7C5_9EUKA|nr:hybrid signal transduction histidine kinase m [Anaeramoeba flamelloides]